MLPRAKKSYGQNFLNDPGVVGKILSAAEIKKGETVLEIGPGTGVLTQGLVDAGAKVIAVEADKDLIPALCEKFGDHIELIEGDILKILPLVTMEFPPEADPPLAEEGVLLRPYSLVANIPYNITSELLHRFLTAENPPTRMVLMVQREVADRITARPPKMSLLSVVCQLYADCQKIANVPAGAFRPIPKVDSAIIRLDPYFYQRVGLVRQKTRNSSKNEQKAFTNAWGWYDPERVIRLAKAGFSSKRKQLHKNLSAAGVASSLEAKNALERIKLDPRIRAEGLTVENWLALAQVFHY